MKTSLPYFYIIQHISSGYFYAGCKFGRKSNPATFLTPGGYLTSSKKVQNIIKKEGIQSFKIIRLLTEEVCGIPVYEYETRFLRENNISRRKNWFNKHDNKIIVYGSQEFKDAMVDIYGVEFFMCSTENKTMYFEKIKQKYGDHITSTFQLEWVKEKSKKTCLEKYGVENARQCEEIKEKTKKTLNVKYGEQVNNPMDHLPFVNKIFETCEARYGVKYPRNIPGVIEKTNATRKKLQERPIVTHIQNFLDDKKMIAKQFGLHRQWKYISIEELIVFCKKQDINYIHLLD